MSVTFFRGGGGKTLCRKGFTLAEVLITLGIIGIVSALVIPQLIPHLEKMKTEAKLKKFYSTIAQATQKAEAEYGDWSTWNYDTNLHTFYDTYYKNNLSTAKVTYDTKSNMYVYVTLQDGTCALLKSNGRLISFKSLYWGISTNCRSGESTGAEGRDYFSLALFNFKNSSYLCNHSPHSCGWPGIDDDWYIPNQRYEKSTCETEAFAWKSYECYLKFVQDGMQFKDDYQFYKQPRAKRGTGGAWN